jgi:hypothetical protein
MLIDHVDQMRPLIASQLETTLRSSLIRGGLIRQVGSDKTELTILGREVLCAVLGEAADHMVRAGFFAEKVGFTLGHKTPLVAIAKEREYD